MTALDTPVLGRTMRAARREAERASAYVLHSVRRAQTIAAAIVALTFGLGVVGLLLGIVPLLLGWPAMVLAAAYGWAFLHARRGPSTLEQGLQLHVLVERDLHEHLSRLATEVGVRCPTEVRLVPESEIWLELDPDRPVLYLGAPLMWHLDLPEFDRMVAGPLSRMRALLDPDVRPGLRLAARLDTRRLVEDTTPLVGSLIRRSGRSLEVRRRSLMDAINQWGDGCLPRALRPTPSDRAELLALREVDDLQAARRLAAAEAGVGIHAPGAAAMATLAGCVQAGVLETGQNRPEPRSASSLLVDATATDRRLGDRTAMIDGQPVPLLEPQEMPRRVWLPRWRDERDAGLPVIVHLTGRWPRTLAELFAVLAPGAVQHSLAVESVDRVPMMGALLTRLPAARYDDEPSATRDDVAEERLRLDAVVHLLTAAVRVAAVEQRKLALWWDDAWGAQLRDGNGEVVPVEAFVGDAVTRRNPRSLLAWLEQVGVDVNATWDESEPPPGGLSELPIAAFAASEASPRVRGIDVVILDGWLLGYPHPRGRWLHDVMTRFRPGESRADELVALARTHRDRLVDVAEPSASVRLADVTAAHVDGNTHAPGWTLRLELPDRRLSFSGRERAAAMGAALEPVLGDRLTRTGTARDDAPVRSWSVWLWRFATQTCLAATLVVAAVLLAGVVDVDRLLPGTGVLRDALAVLMLGTVPALLCKLAAGRADRALRRGGAQSPLAVSTEVDDSSELMSARPVPQPQ